MNYYSTILLYYQKKLRVNEVIFFKLTDILSLMYFMQSSERFLQLLNSNIIQLHFIMSLSIITHRIQELVN